MPNLVVPEMQPTNPRLRALCHPNLLYMFLSRVQALAGLYLLEVLTMAHLVHAARGGGCV